MILKHYLQKQVERYELGETSDAVYRIASHTNILSFDRLRLYDLGQDFSEQEKHNVIAACKTILQDG